MYKGLGGMSRDSARSTEACLLAFTATKERVVSRVGKQLLWWEPA